MATSSTIKDTLRALLVEEHRDAGRRFDEQPSIKRAVYLTEKLCRKCRDEKFDDDAMDWLSEAIDQYMRLIMDAVYDKKVGVFDDEPEVLVNFVVIDMLPMMLSTSSAMWHGTLDMAFGVSASEMAALGMRIELDGPQAQPNGSFVRLMEVTSMRMKLAFTIFWTMVHVRFLRGGVVNDDDKFIVDKVFRECDDMLTTVGTTSALAESADVLRRLRNAFGVVDDGIVDVVATSTTKASKAAVKPGCYREADDCSLEKRDMLFQMMFFDVYA